MCGLAQVWLQEFAWTEEDEAIKVAARELTLPAQARQQPLFCFQTMMHLLYWSCLVYDYKRVNDHLLSRSLTHSLPLTWPLTPSLTHSFTHSLTHSLTHYLTNSLTHSKMSCCVELPVSTCPKDRFCAACFGAATASGRACCAGHHNPQEQAPPPCKPP